MADKKTSFKSKFLNIITFGHLSRKAKKLAKEQAENKNTELKVNTIALPDMEKLTNGLGGKDNVISVSSTISTVKFTLKDPTKVNFDILRAVTTKGIIKSTNDVTLVVGDCAAELSKQFNN